jgi:integrase
MRNPSHLWQSRHDVYYFRFPMPQRLHPQSKQSHIKISLDTRCPQEALHYVRPLLYLAHQVINMQAIKQMEYRDIRAALLAHFEDMRERLKERIATNGRLTRHDRASFDNGRGLAATALEQADYSFIGTNEQLAHFIEKQELPIKLHDKDFSVLRTEFIRAFRDYCTIALEHDDSMDAYSFASSLETHPKVNKTHSTRKRKLADAIKEYTAEKLRVRDWTDKTAKSAASQFNLLLEYLGEDASLNVSSEDAINVKRMLTKLPKHHRKKPELRTLSLNELMGLGGQDTLDSPTITKHLTVYSGFFDWAVKRKEADENNFKALIDKVKKDDEGKERFTNEQINVLLDECLNNTRGLINKSYQKWCVPIGIYTGMRLNEIAQLHIEDIREVEGIWCFDINGNGSTKRIKNKASKRIVPIHSCLVALGFLDYVERLRSEGQGRVFPDLPYQSSDGYGRNLSRWCNEVLLTKLGIKSPELSFHSLRHTVADELMKAGVYDHISHRITGHTLPGVFHEVYAKGYKEAQLKEAIEKLSYT